MAEDMDFITEEEEKEEATREVTEPSGRQVTFEVTMKTKYMFSFLFYNSYYGVRGIINYALSAVAIVALIFGFGDSAVATFFLVLLAMLFTVIEPLMLLFKAFRQVKTSESFKLPMTYTFAENAFYLQQGEIRQQAPWELVLLVRETGSLIILFTGGNNAILLPKDQISDIDELKSILRIARPDETKKLK